MNSFTLTKENIHHSLVAYMKMVEVDYECSVLFGRCQKKKKNQRKQNLCKQVAESYEKSRSYFSCASHPEARAAILVQVKVAVLNSRHKIGHRYDTLLTRFITAAFITYLMFSRRHLSKGIIHLTHPITLLPIITIPVNFWENLLTRRHLKLGHILRLRARMRSGQSVCQQRSIHTFILSAKQRLVYNQ